jgi:lambda repressor-like predicted transcriptional regulator
MRVDKLRGQIKALISAKKTNKVQLSISAGVGYHTIGNILKEDYAFEIKQNTLEKVERAVDELR